MSARLHKKRQPRGKHLHVVERRQKLDRYSTREVATAEVGKQIIFNPTILDTFDVKGFQPLHYDLLVLCAAVEFVDRRWKRPHDWTRSLQVTVPVIQPAIWQRPGVTNSLQSTLRQLTGDNWNFTFVLAKDCVPVGIRQAALGFPKTKTLVAAYSDGLDSLAVAALSGGEDKVLCIRVANRRQRLKRGDTPFAQIPFKVVGHGSNESSFRSRGFQFAVVAAIAAHLSEVSRIVVPESGQGALGPVLMPLHNIYPDYRNHPKFFRNMERFIVAVLGHHVRFEQPRLWYTKGQTMRAFLELPGKSEDDLKCTHSCWQKRRIVNLGGARKQCGLCAACLLRRLSLHAARVSEAPNAYVVSDLKSSNVIAALSAIPLKADRDIMIEYGSVGARHLQHLADMATFPESALRPHVAEIATATGESYEETLTKLRTLLVTHAEEWRAFMAAQGQYSFLKSWVTGGRNDQPE